MPIQRLIQNPPKSGISASHFNKAQNAGVIAPDILFAKDVYQKYDERMNNLVEKEADLQRRLRSILALYENNKNHKKYLSKEKPALSAEYDLYREELYKIQDEYNTELNEYEYELSLGMRHLPQNIHEQKLNVEKNKMLDAINKKRIQKKLPPILARDFEYPIRPNPKKGRLNGKSKGWF